MEEIEYLKKENETLKKELVKITKLVDRLNSALLLCREQMMPLDVAKKIDNVLYDVENY